MNDGYVVDDSLSGFIEDGKPELIEEGGVPFVFDIERNEEANRLVIENVSIPFSVENENPNSCNSDAVEGIETEFVVNFDYRLATSDSAIIAIGEVLREVPYRTKRNQ